MNRDQTATAVLGKIRERLKENPGKPLPVESSLSELPRAAVAMIVRPHPTSADVSILLIKRKVRDNDPWSGNVALPGGRSSMADKDLFATAVREVQEETGLDLQKLEILGTLDEIVSTNFLIRVTPFVAAMTSRNDNCGGKKQQQFSLKMETREIESYAWVPLAYFMDKNNATTIETERLGRKLELPSYRFGEDYVVWGMTLRIIEDLLAKLR